MTTIALNNISYFPDMRDMLINALSGSTAVFDTSTDVMALMFQLPATGTIANIHYRVITSTSPVMTLRTELRTAPSATTGLPPASGTLYGSSTSITSANPTTGNKTAAINCTGATAGDLVSLVFDLSAFTSGSFAIASRYGGTLQVGSIPYQMTNTAGSDVLAALNINTIGVEYSGDTYYSLGWNCICAAAITSPTVSNSGLLRRGNRIRTPVPLRSVGAWVAGDLDGDCLIRLRLASDDSILATATIDKDQRGSTSVSSYQMFWDAKATATLSANVDYYILLEGNSATTSTITLISSIPENAQLDMISGGRNCYGTSYTSPSYTDVDTSRYAIGIMYDGMGASAVKTWNGVDIALIGTINGA